MQCYLLRFCPTILYPFNDFVRANLAWIFDGKALSFTGISGPKDLPKQILEGDHR